jgi:hypothetical protein
MDGVKPDMEALRAQLAGMGLEGLLGGWDQLSPEEQRAFSAAENQPPKDQTEVGP